MPEISIIVPVYKVEQYLPRCIDSILAQTFTDFELLLIDDGSPDNSGKICDEYAAKDSRIRVFHKENGGAASARNMGLDNAISPWISFVDSDDYISVNMLERAFVIQKSTSADIVEFGIKTVWEYEDPCQTSASSKIQTFSGTEMISRIFKDCFGGCVYQWNKIYSSLIFSDLRFETGRENEDTIIAPIEYYNADKVTVTDEILYYYFAGASSVTRAEFSLKKLDILYAFESNRNFCIENGLKKEKNLVDATYAFILQKSILKVEKKYGAECCTYKELCRKFIGLFSDFLKNPKINLRQKLRLFRFFLGIKKINTEH